MNQKQLRDAHREGDDIRWSFFFRLALLILGLACLTLLAWNLAHLLLLAFLAVLVSILIRSFAATIRDTLRLPSTASLGLSTTLLLLLLVGFFLLLGSTLQTQLNQLIDRAPDLLAALAERFGVDDPQRAVAEQLEKTMEQTSLLARFAGLSSTALGAITNFVLVLIAGVYLAADPGTYRKGFLLLFPLSTRSEASQTLDVVVVSLRLWLVGQLLGMLLVGALSAAGLWYLGVPSALALGVIAGLFEFIPILGPIIAAIPAVAAGFAESQELGYWVLGLYVLIQQVEGNLLMPLIQQRMVRIPPALTVFAVVGFALLFGPLGALIAMPLLVVLSVVIKKVWIRETLDEDVQLPGEGEDRPLPAASGVGRDV